MGTNAYYPIKGFVSQFNETILEVLQHIDNREEKICFENKEDIDTSKYVIQVKYHESQEYTPSSLREPIQKLYDDFNPEEDSRARILLVHFKNREEGETHFTTEEILKTFKININEDDTKLEKFCSNFGLNFISNFDNRYQIVINKIIESLVCNQEEAEQYYSIILNIILFKVIKNPLGHERERYITFNEILDKLPNNNLSKIEKIIKNIDENVEIVDMEINSLPDNAKSYFFSLLSDTETRLKFLEHHKIEEIANKFERAFISNKLKKKYYYAVINIISPVFVDRRDVQIHERLQQLFRITENLEESFIKELEAQELLKIDEGICIIEDKQQAQAWLELLIEGEYLTIDDLFELFG